MLSDVTEISFDLSWRNDELSIFSPARYRPRESRIYFTHDLIKGLAVCDDDFQAGVHKYSLMRRVPFHILGLRFILSLRIEKLAEKYRCEAGWVNLFDKIYYLHNLNA